VTRRKVEQVGTQPSAMLVDTHGRRDRKFEVEAAPELQPIALRSMFWRPDFLEASDWIEHVPFAFWLVEAQRPKLIVELGVGAGTSYFALCQAVERLGLDARCFGIDAWSAATPGGGARFARAFAHNDARYSRFSRLLRDSFEAARRNFSAGSIDLLSIDGEHSIEAVNADFENWASKLSDRAVVLLNASNMREPGYGVHQIVERLQSRFPTFEFVHGQGLAVVGIGPEQNGMVQRLFDAARVEDAQSGIRDVFARLGRACLDALQAGTERERATGLALRAQEDGQRVAQVGEMLETARRDLAAQASALEEARERLALQTERHALERGQLAERATMLQEMQGELRRQLEQAREQLAGARERPAEPTAAQTAFAAQTATAVAALEQRLDQLLAQSRQQAEAAREMAQSGTEAAAGLRAELDRERGRAAEAIRAAERIGADLAGERARVADALRDTAQSNAALDSARAELAEAASRAAQAKARADALDVELAALRTRAEEAMQDSARARAASESEAASGQVARAHAEELSTLVGQLRAEAAQAHGEAAHAQADAEQAQADARDLGTRLEEATRELGLAHSQAAAARREQASATAELGVAAAARAEAETARAQAEASLRSRFKEIAQLTRRLLEFQGLQTVDATALADTRAARREAEIERDALQTERLALRTRLMLDGKAIADLRNVAAQLHKSRSWRWTRPIRALRNGSGGPEGAQHAPVVDGARLVRASPLFDGAWYLSRYEDVAQAGLDPVEHFLAFGGVEARDPGPHFDSRAYLDANPDVAEAGANPLLHYLEHGVLEGRRLRGDG
jgi:hypothetical protein